MLGDCKYHCWYCRCSSYTATSPKVISLDHYFRVSLCSPELSTMVCNEFFLLSAVHSVKIGNKENRHLILGKGGVNVTLLLMQSALRQKSAAEKN